MSRTRLAIVGFGREALDALKKLRRSRRRIAFLGLNLAMILLSALIIWTSLMVITNSNSPVIVVLSESMMPGIQRGDILLIDNGDTPIRAGDIVVFEIKGRDIPIVHRVMNVHEKSDRAISVLTKGDFNIVNDRGLYAPGQTWVGREDILGRARVKLPYVGMITICLDEYPLFKYALLALMVILVMVNQAE